MAYWGNDYVTIKEMSFYKATISSLAKKAHTCVLFTRKKHVLKEAQAPHQHAQ